VQAGMRWGYNDNVMRQGQQCPQWLQNNSHLFLKEFIAAAGVATIAINFLLQQWWHKYIEGEKLGNNNQQQ
jgi:hypothetical protein